MTFVATRPHFSPLRRKKVNQKGGEPLHGRNFCKPGKSPLNPSDRPKKRGILTPDQPFLPIRTVASWKSATSDRSEPGQQTAPKTEHLRECLPPPWAPAFRPLDPLPCANLSRRDGDNLPRGKSAPMFPHLPSAHSPTFQGANPSPSAQRVAILTFQHFRFSAFQHFSISAFSAFPPGTTDVPPPVYLFRL